MVIGDCAGSPAGAAFGFHAKNKKRRKQMKKAVMLFTMLLLGMSVPTVVYAETNAGVWCETNVEDGNNLSVSIETNGKATDGVLAIDYDPSVISCTEKDVEIADSVEMYSVNVVDESVRISFLSENAVDAGTIAEIAFKVVDENADEDTLKAAVSLTGEAHNETGGVIVVRTEETPAAPTETPAASTETPAAPTETPAAPTETPVAPTETPAAPTETPAASTEAPGTPGNPDGGNGQQGGTDADSGDGTSKTPDVSNTGDDTNFSAYLILSLVTGGLLVAFAIRQVLAGTGRKLNH